MGQELREAIRMMLEMVDARTGIPPWLFTEEDTRALDTLRRAVAGTVPGDL